MTVDIDADEEQTVPSPQPVDLFESHPDPVLYFDDRGEGPVVRAVNDAFSEMFGVGTDTVAGAALADVLMVAERSGDVVEAAADADQFDAILDCETVEGQTRFYVRVVALGDETGARGYVLYSPVRPGETPR